MKKILIGSIGAAAVAVGLSVVPAVTATAHAEVVGTMGDQNADNLASELRSDGIPVEDAARATSVATWVCNFRAAGIPSPTLAKQFTTTNHLSYPQAVDVISASEWHFCPRAQTG
jgi:hypothetical protein